MNPIEAKVIAAIAGGGLGGAIGQFLLWLLGVLVWHASNTADAATAATAAVPEPVSMLLVALMAAVGAGLAGYSAPHTDRPATPVIDQPLVASVPPVLPASTVDLGYTIATAPLAMLDTPTPVAPPVVGPPA
jgi:hypothetical protein